MKRRQKPIIMTATMGDEDFAWANALRQRYYPSERNFLSAHVTLFYHLPPQGLDEIVGLIKETTRNNFSPKSKLVDVIHLGRGVAYKLHSPELLEIRQFYAESFHGLLTQQDQQKSVFISQCKTRFHRKRAKTLFRNSALSLSLDLLK